MRPGLTAPLMAIPRTGPGDFDHRRGLLSAQAELSEPAIDPGSLTNVPLSCIASQPRSTTSLMPAPYSPASRAPCTGMWQVAHVAVGVRAVTAMAAMLAFDEGAVLDQRADRPAFDGSEGGRMACRGSLRCGLGAFSTQTDGSIISRPVNAVRVRCRRYSVPEAVGPRSDISQLHSHPERAGGAAPGSLVPEMSLLTEMRSSRRL
jgi:hypothetical protein